MSFELTTDAFFDSAHFLPDYFGKCENIHGHRWKVTVAIKADDLQSAGSEAGMVQDFGAFKKIVREEVAKFDHMFLVEDGSLQPETVAALEGEGFNLLILPFRTTAENLAKNFAEIFASRGLAVSWVEVDETPNNRAKYVI